MKPKYTLHKLPEGFIITSDEEIKEGDLYFLESVTTKNMILKANESKSSTNCKKVIAQQNQIDFSALSDEEQKKIGWFEVEEWVKQTTSSLKDDMMLKTSQMCLKAGFQKAQELLSDRRFTLEDIKKAYNKGRNHGANYKHQCGDYDSIKDINDADKWSEKVESEFIQSLSQPKTWDIELEMEDGGGYREDSMNGCWIPKWQPKLTNGKIKITKLL